jgi:myosin-5
MLAMGYSPGVSTGVVDKIISANPILEAFGNAKTTRNNNSSRFGKWLQVVYDGGLSILGSKNKTFLLEKSRVVFQSVGEHNFHIFYFLLFGAPQELKIKLQLNSATFSVWKYVQWSSSSRPTDKETLAPLITHFNEMKLSFESLNFKPNEINALFQIIAGILHLGNCEYIAMDAGHVEGSQLSRETKHWMTTAAELLEVDGKELEMWTTRDETSVRAQHFLGGKVVELSMYLTLWCLILVVSFFFVKVQKSSGASFTLKHLNVLDANSARDSSSKAIYSKLFDWLVTRINDECLPKEAAEKQVNFIGLLDIFGFERFDSNGFDQLCKVSSYWSFDFRVEC